MSRHHRPHGPAPTAWEADVLKIRAFEMVLVLFYVETLRRFILESIRASDRVSGEDRLGDGKSKANEGTKMERARALLVSEGIISQAESDEIFGLADYRNLVGHQVHELAADIGAHSDLVRLDPETFRSIPPYDYTAAKRAKEMKKKVERRMMGKFIIPIGFEALQFGAAERTYLTEIERLKVRVNNGIAKANKLTGQTNQIIKSIPKVVVDAAQPYHSRNTRENGSLTRAGGACAFQLFDAQATSLAVAYMMKISLRSAKLWFKKWQANKP